MIEENNTPMNEELAGAYAESLAALAYYPKEAAARTLIGMAIMEICRTSQDAAWLSRRALELHTSWSTCGVKGLWQIWFSKHRPRSKKEHMLELQSGSTESYPDGVPSESAMPDHLLETKTMFALPAGVAVSVDPGLEQLVIEKAELIALPPLPKYRARKPDEIRVDELLRRMHNEPVPAATEKL